MHFHDPPQLPRGFRCGAARAGLKADAPDLALFVSDEPCVADAVFTTNHVVGAPVVLGREVTADGRLQAVVVNSGVANVGLGPEGLDAARRMADATAAALGVPGDLVLVASTGVIGIPLPVHLIESALPALASSLGTDPVAGARGMMTTDTHPKAMSVAVGPATLTVVGKGSGMIAPNMATMLVFAFTDARVERAALQRIFRDAVDETFNMLSVDTDTSTSDMCAVLANGLAGPVEEEAFAAALRGSFRRMTEVLARDGEGATSLLRVRVRGAATRDEARVVARSVVDSPLIKTMVYGGDPNVGRILMAVGKCFDCTVDPERIDASINGVAVLRAGRRADFDETRVRGALRSGTVDLDVVLGVGEGEAWAWGCDLTEGYVQENAAYYSS